ncbi:MFS transporter [Mycolicibacterium arenosum]|uniref:MFS transporter n=1 Tax=Mycolicibacterium arenosum TaxID=2952157 RepID=A0ABT1MBN1_9MYCO|nr:MFS transporter [Mycolicibacterium sp. CAU 1645]MCP9275925.1 MFS transporter [Mycolicibacterium sp. CAU 1645]
MFAYQFLNDFVLLYPVYTLLFSDSGLNVGEISALFVIWTMASLAFEVPSGALADTVSRRALLVIAPLLTVVTFALWVWVPSFWVFAVGFALWGLKSALTSGALEALVFEELQRVGAQHRYATIMGRGEVAGATAAMLAGLAAAPAIAAGGYPAVGIASVVSSVAASAAATLLPENRNHRNLDVRTGWTASLIAGLGEARTSRGVRAAVLLVVVVTAIWGALDEYAPLLVAGYGVDAAEVSLLMVVVWAGAAAGGLLAGCRGDAGNRGLAGVLGCGAVLMAAGAVIPHPAAVVALAAAFGAFQWATIAADTRLQQSIRGDARATVTSLAGMSTDVLTLAVYGSYALLAAPGGHGGAFVALMVPYALLAAALSARPSAAPDAKR